jgi:prepilin-type N-terminal cleavage/methylation domain-containing protein
MRNKAFTLIELLVVIAIIAILAAILFPAFAQAKAAAKKSVCLTHMKQIGICLSLYGTDNNDMLCQTSWESTNTTQPFNPLVGGKGKYQIHWTYLMQPYLKSWDIFVCPTDAKPTTPKFPAPNGVGDLGKLDGTGNMYCDWQAPAYSYIPNYNVLPAHDWVPVNQTIYSRPSSTIAIAERRALLTNGTAIGQQKGLSGFNPSQPCPGSVQVAPQFAPLTGAPNRYAFWTEDFAKQHLAVDTSDKNDIIRVNWTIHDNGSNYIYVDTHARFKQLGQTLDPNKYEYGDQFYPAFAPYSGVCAN